MLPTDVVRDACIKLTEHAAAGRIQIETERYDLDRALDAWHAQPDSPYRKLVIVP